MTLVPTKPGQGVVSELGVHEVGDSLAVALPEEVISRLSIQDGTPLLPHDPGFQARMAKAHDIIGRYRNTLHALAR